MNSGFDCLIVLVLIVCVQYPCIEKINSTSFSTGHLCALCSWQHNVLFKEFKYSFEGYFFSSHELNRNAFVLVHLVTNKLYGMTPWHISSTCMYFFNNFSATTFVNPVTIFHFLETKFCFKKKTVVLF